MKWYIIIFISLFLFGLWITFYFKKRKAIWKVKHTSEEEKLSYINMALSPFGFIFDSVQDIVISKNNCFQRMFGYQDLYDLKAPLLHIVMDCEPIYFNYNQKEYRIEFWKGQYGITTGAEIGIYIRDKHTNLPKGKYRSATDEERLNMGFVLEKKCKLFHRKDTSWWLTGFVVGLFSKPKELKMKCFVECENEEMKNCFVKGLRQAGYPESKINVCENIVYFSYCTPKNYKLNHKKKIKKSIVQWLNRFNCFIFNFFTRRFPLTIDKLTYLRYLFPHIYQLFMGCNIPKKRQKTFHNKNISQI